MQFVFKVNVRVMSFRIRGFKTKEVNIVLEKGKLLRISTFRNTSLKHNIVFKTTIKGPKKLIFSKSLKSLYYNFLLFAFSRSSQVRRWVEEMLSWKQIKNRSGYYLRSYLYYLLSKKQCSLIKTIWCPKKYDLLS
jgi:hypothetical protein